MKFEAVEFYPVARDDEKGFLSGTMHLFWVDKKLDLRGIKVQRKKDKYFAFLPYVTAVDFDTGDVVRYPLLLPVNEEEKITMIEEIRKAAKDYIIKNVLIKKCKPFDRIEEQKTRIKNDLIKKDYARKERFKQKALMKQSKI